MKHAFTLIELLIVVAIIAILAAIAVPNFLEAQTRAKVSRTQNDMRSLATAIESYTVDNNKPMTCFLVGPLAVSGASVLFPEKTSGAVSPRFIRLTTPIAYMTSILRDPFVNTAEVRGSSTYDTYDYICAFDFLASTLLPNDKRGASITSGAAWRLASAGPDKQQFYGGAYKGVAGNSKGVDYDPTNGTTSVGDIVRVGGGPGPLSGDATYVPCIDRVKNVYNENPLTQ